MVFLEAQALGVPVVSTTHGGIPEAVQQGRSGLLAPPGDIKTLAHHLLRYLQDAELRQSASRAGIDFVHERFDIRKQTVRLEEVYKEALT
jgi:colanic acid/amylovoran biosynthesis glycosyltransferase